MDRQDAFERRLARMEREIRWYRAGAALALMALAGGGLVSAQAPASPPAAPGPAPAEVRAQRFMLVGAQGEVRGGLEVPAEGGPRIWLADAGGRPRVSLQVAVDGAPSVTLSDSAGNRRVALEATVAESRVSVLGLGRTTAMLANDAGVPRVALADGAGRERVWLAVRMGSPALQFLDVNGAPRTGLTTFNNDSGVAVVTATDRSQPGLVLIGKNGVNLWSWP